MSQIFPWSCFYCPFTMIQRSIQEIQNKTQHKIPSLKTGCRWHNRPFMVSPPLCLPVTDKPAWSRSCVFSCMCLVTAVKALTPSCLAPTLRSVSPGEPRLLLSSSLSKLNNHEEKNITCGEFAPFSFASHYPNSALILYHYYPPTNDRVGARLSLTTYNTTHTTQAAIPSQCLALCLCPWAAHF